VIDFTSVIVYNHRGDKALADFFCVLDRMSFA
jgi:hypothetical protein